MESRAPELPCEARVLHLISSSGFLGAENVVLELAVQSRTAGFDVSIGVIVNERNPNHELAEAARSRGFQARVYPCSRRLDRGVIGGIREWIRCRGVDILHTHNYKSNFYAWRALRGETCSWVITNHGRRSGFRLLLYNLADAYVARHADRVVAVSGRIARTLRCTGVPGGKVRVIDNGIDTDRFAERRPTPELRSSLGIQADAFVIGTVGALSREKGHTFLLRAAPEVIESLPSAVFLVVGDGPERPALREEAVRLGVSDRVVFAGSRTDIPEILGIMDLFVLPSVQEGLPMALLEAQAAGVPTVATEVGAIPAVIRDGVTGLLVPPGNPAAIADSIVRLLSNPDAARSMAASGAARVRDDFSADVMARKYLDLYREILGDK